MVAPLAGSVDRNDAGDVEGQPVFVAPLAGSVDRNGQAFNDLTEIQKVAPLAGSVDRNSGRCGPEAAAARRSPRGERG